MDEEFYRRINEWRATRYSDRVVIVLECGHSYVVNIDVEPYYRKARPDTFYDCEQCKTEL